jgi:nucleoside 2-deoxyribosyltransferase
VKLYIAGPMASYPQRNRAAFDEAADLLRDAGYDVVHPGDLHGQGWPPADDVVDTEERFRAYMRTDLRALLDCGGVALLEDWHRSRGARIEFGVARDTGIPVEPVDRWLQAAQLAHGQGISTWSVRDPQRFIAAASGADAAP